ncbi:MAG: lytic transglycosylase domain-containing protein [Litorimonas sp.]
MQGDGSLSASTSQTTFSRSYEDGVGRSVGEEQLAVREPGSDGADGPIEGDFQTVAVAARAPSPRPLILDAIDETALRYASHPGLRRAGLTVTEWRLLYRANIEVESAYDPAALSAVGAVGLGQLMPATASDLGVDPHDWRENLDGSARYLAMMLRQFGDVRLALAAYNAGPGAVVRHDGIPPFPETRNHVRRVLAVRNRLEGERS